MIESDQSRTRSTPADETVAVVVHFGDPALTAAAVSSITAAQVKPRAVVVVDNGPVELRDDFAGMDVDVLHPGTNLGFGAGVMFAVAREPAASARYLWLINNDAEAEPGSLAALLSAVTVRSDRALVASVVLEQEGRVWSTAATYYPWLLTARHDRRLPDPPADVCASDSPSWRRIRYLPACSLLVPTQLLSDVGGFDPTLFLYGEDVDLSLRAQSAGASLVVAARSVVRHRASSGTDAPTREGLIAESCLRLTRHHYPPLVPWALVGGVLVGVARCVKVRATWPLTSRIRGYSLALARPTRGDAR